MPPSFEHPILDLNEIPEDECKHLPLNCLWNLISKDTSLTAILTFLKWTFKYDIRVRVTVYSLRAPNVSKQIDLDDHHSLLRSLTDALNVYEIFPEPHLNTYQLEV